MNLFLQKNLIKLVLIKPSIKNNIFKLNIFIYLNKKNIIRILQIGISVLRLSTIYFHYHLHTFRRFARLLMRHFSRRWCTNTVRRIRCRKRRRVLCAIRWCRKMASRSYQYCGDSCYALTDHRAGRYLCRKHFRTGYCRGKP